jgi:hypothetical protein
VREVLNSAMEKRWEEDDSGQILLVEVACPIQQLKSAWQRLHADTQLQLVVYPKLWGEWRVGRGPRLGPASERAKLLLFRGLEDEALVRETGIEGAMYVHRSGLTAGFKTKEAALAFARLVLRPPWMAPRELSEQEDFYVPRTDRYVARSIPQSPPRAATPASPPRADSPDSPPREFSSPAKAVYRPPNLARNRPDEPVFYYSVCFHQYHIETLTSNLTLDAGDFVLSTAERGLDIGRVVCAFRHDDHKHRGRMTRIVRRATPADLTVVPETRGDEQKALEICHRCILGENMDIVGVEYPFEGPKWALYFYSPKGVDYKPLLARLTQALRHRIWMHRVEEQQCGPFPR